MFAEIQSGLERHFYSLARERAGLGYPVYALEHGFDSQQVTDIRNHLNTELGLSRGLDQRLWLLWVIVAAEIGYAFDGDEYWVSFSRSLPNWRRFADRSTDRSAVRSWFEKFTHKYKGYQPSGRWADHFSIIAWPITHSILPRDLQTQFARRIYELRYELARHKDASTAELGRIIRSENNEGSSRFQYFLEQTELVARLVLALRDEDVTDSVSPIFRPTLARIVADLENRRLARDWLNEARRILRQARIRLSPTLVPSVPVPTPVINPLAGPGHRHASLVGRKNIQDEWILGLALPDIGRIIQDAGVGRKELDHARIRFSDQPDGWHPGRALLTFSKNEYPLLSMPDIIDKPIFIFDRAIDSLREVISEQVRLKGRSNWLLRIQSDGVARDVVGRHVRANETYLFVSESRLNDQEAKRLHLVERTSQTNGVHVFELTTPSQFQPDYLQALQALNLGYSLRANIEPVGLVPRWDSQTECTVWLANETPVICLTAECPLQEFTLTLDGGTVTRIPMGDRESAILSLGNLALGAHVVEVGGIIKPRPGFESHRKLEAEKFYLEVRAPSPWNESIRAIAGFRVLLDPKDASLDSLLNGSAKLTFIGPPERSVAIELRTYGPNGHVNERRDLGTIKLLHEDRDLRRIYSKISKDPIAELIQSTPKVELAFQSEELGTDVVSFPHDVQPLRWKLAAVNGSSQVRLIDDTGADNGIEIKRYEILLPDRSVALEHSASLAGLDIQAPGALFVARYNDRRYSAIVSLAPERTERGLSILGLDVQFHDRDVSTRGVLKLIKRYRLWSRSGVLGPLGGLRKQSVLNAIEQRIMRLMCGNDWANDAMQCDSEQSPYLVRIQNAVQASPGFASRMKSTDWSKLHENPELVADFIAKASTYGISDNQRLGKLALCLAFKPGSTKFGSSDEGEQLITQLMQIQPLMRGAYLARISTDLRRQAVVAREGNS